MLGKHLSQISRYLQPISAKFCILQYCSSAPGTTGPVETRLASLGRVWSLEPLVKFLRTFTHDTSPDDLKSEGGRAPEKEVRWGQRRQSWPSPPSCLRGPCPWLAWERKQSSRWTGWRWLAQWLEPPLLQGDAHLPSTLKGEWPIILVFFV